MNRLINGQRLLRVLVFIGMTMFVGSITSALSFAEDQSPASSEQMPAESEESGAVSEEVNPSIILKGRVWRTKPGIVFLKTPLGLLTLSSKTTLKDLRASHEALFWVHGPYLAVDILKRADGSRLHRYLGGPFTQHDGEDNTLLRWTPEGEKAFYLGPHEQSLPNLRDSDVVTVEVDETDTVIGVHKLQFDLQIGQIPADGSDTHLLLTGTVSKLKSNFIFFRTPVGVINVNAKIGIKRAKVGQTMTLHIHQHHVIVDLSAPNTASSVRRFVTGPLEFTSPDRTSVRLWTPEGEQTYPTDHGKTALAGAKEGRPITVELNGQGTVVKFHRLK